MTILCLAIVGKNNEPLYLCDCEFDKKDADDESLEDLEDVFGFSEEASKGVENNLLLDKEVRTRSVFADKSIFLCSLLILEFFLIFSVAFNACLSVLDACCVGSLGGSIGLISRTSESSPDREVIGLAFSVPWEMLAVTDMPPVQMLKLLSWQKMRLSPSSKYSSVLSMNYT